MVFFFPDSVWPFIFHKHIDNYGLGDNPLAWIFYNKMSSKKAFKRKAFMQLKTTGHTSSYRLGIKGISKILVIGNKAGAGHTHMDKGSFIYEYGGETFLMDPGICPYDNPISLELKAPDRHNMLVPFGGESISRPQNPLMCEVIPKAYGDEKIFSANIDLTETWTVSYLKWIRKIDSPDPETLVVKDEYSLKHGDGVCMVFNSPLDINESGRQIFINGKSGRLVIDIPEDCTAKIDNLPHPVITHNRLRIFKNGKQGVIAVNMKMEPLL